MWWSRLRGWEGQIPSDRGCSTPAACTHVCPALPAFSVPHGWRPHKGWTPRFPFRAGSQSACTSPHWTCGRGAVTVGLRLLPETVCSSQAAALPRALGGSGRAGAPRVGLNNATGARFRSSQSLGISPQTVMPENLLSASAFLACPPKRDTAVPTPGLSFLCCPGN